MFDDDDEQQNRRRQTSIIHKIQFYKLKAEVKIAAAGQNQSSIIDIVLTKRYDSSSDNDNNKNCGKRDYLCNNGQ